MKIAPVSKERGRFCLSRNILMLEHQKGFPRGEAVMKIAQSVFHD
jgi:hypothetical protein